MATINREELAAQYLETLPFTPYPLQEEAILSWFLSDEGVLVCAPTGTGKTVIAQAALYEALKSGTVAYYTTPLIALSEQKFYELQAVAEKWGFSKDDIGLITGNRKVNPDAPVLVVVAEILLNRLMKGEDFSNVSSVIMDEFHSFADAERGIVWELSLSMLPKKCRLMLLSATVGNSSEFLSWLDRNHERKLELVEGTERKVPLTYHWIPNDFLNDLLVDLAKGDDAGRKTPTLVFAFNRDECWSIAEQLKGLNVIDAAQKTAVNAQVDQLEWSTGVGPKLKQMLRRGVGVHHAGLLPKYRRVVEQLFEQKLLGVALCTETLAAGINLPARSVVLTSLVKGPFGKEKVIDASSAHQIFGRAGRPQYDIEGHVYTLPHEDDVRIARWKEKFDQIPEDTKDPQMIKKRKELNRKKPTRNSQRKYWTESDFEKLQNAAPTRLYSKGPIPWRLLAYLLEASSDVERIRGFIRKRLLDQPRIESSIKQLTRMLLTLHDMGYVALDPIPQKPEDDNEPLALNPPEDYTPIHAVPTEKLNAILHFRAVHPLYGHFMVQEMATMNTTERIQALESILELPRPLLKFVRVPYEIPAGDYTKQKLDVELIARGLITAQPEEPEEEEEDRFIPWDERPPHFADKLRMLFEAQHPDVTDVSVQPVWAAGEILEMGGNFEGFIANRELAKQEGLIFRHILRLILLIDEFAQITPEGIDPKVWKAELRDIAQQLTKTCQSIDPSSTQQTIANTLGNDPLLPEGEGAEHIIDPSLIDDHEEAFGEGLDMD